MVYILNRVLSSLLGQVTQITMTSLSALLTFLETHSNVKLDGSPHHKDYAILKLSSETSVALSQSGWKRFNRLKHLMKAILLETQLEELYAAKPEIPRIIWFFYYKNKVEQLRRDWEKHMDKSLDPVAQLSELGCNDQ